MKNGQIFHVNFNGCIGQEINKVHLAIIFKLPNLKNLFFCIPLTSPKLKHFKTEKYFVNRNYKNIKHINWQYINQTDSIALLDQIKTISKSRLLKEYRDKNNEPITLNDKNKKIIIDKLFKYMKLIFK